MKRHPITAVLLTCPCGLVRAADDYSAAHARGKAHTSFSGHQALAYSLIEAPERLRDAQGIEQRSRKAVKGYVEDACAGPLSGVSQEV